VAQATREVIGKNTSPPAAVAQTTREVLASNANPPVGIAQALREVIAVNPLPAAAEFAQHLREVLAASASPGATFAQALREVIAANPPPTAAQIGQALSEIIAANASPPAQIAQAVREVLVGNPPTAAQIGQALSEIIAANASPPAQIAQAVREVLVGNPATFAGIAQALGEVIAANPSPGAAFAQALKEVIARNPGAHTAVLADLFFSTTAGFVDLTVASNRRAFISAAGGAQKLGTGGSAPYGVTPAVFLTSNGTPASFATNAGRGGAFTGGTLAAGGTNPPGATQTVITEQANSPGQGVLGDYASGNLYAFNPATKLDNGVQRRWLRTWRAIDQGTPAAKRFAALWIDMQTGAGVPNGTKPQVMLRWSDDGGHTWSDARIEDVGPLGATATTVKFNRLGATRRFGGSDRIFELSSSDPFMVAILDAGVEVA
jgi:hypothetical protein